MRGVIARVLVVGALAAALVACGDDDEDGDVAAEETSTTSAAEGTTSPEAEGASATDFCDGVVAFNGAANEVELTPESSEAEVRSTGQELNEVWEPVRENAPESVADEVETLTGVLEQVAEGDGEAFQSDETFATYGTVLEGAVEECDFETTSVTGVNYAFEGVPATLPSGTVAVEFTNEATDEMHEFIAFRKNNPDQPTDEILSLPEEEGEQAITFAGAAFAPPGESSTTLVTLEPGSYVAVCFIPVGADPDAPPGPPEEGEEPVGGPPHFTQGMVAEFTVE